MRKWMRIGGFAALAAVALVFLSCLTETPVSIATRISDFVTSLNGDRTDTYKNLNSSIAAYQAAATPTYWDTHFATTDEPFSVDTSALNISDPTDVLATISYGGGLNKQYKFNMINTGVTAEVWYIDDISVLVSSTWTSIF